MASTVALSVLRTRAKQRADMENSTFVSDAEWLSYINDSAAWLYDLLVKAYDEDYYLTSTTFETSTASNYTWATISMTDFYKLRGVSIIPVAGEEVPLKRYTFGDRGRTNNFYSSNRLGRTALRYRLGGDSIEFRPTPQAGQTIKLWYIPSITLLSQDTDTIDGINGWEEFVVLNAAILAGTKEETDTSALVQQRQIYLDRIETMAEDRDVGEPAKVTDAQRDYDFYSEWDGMEF
jgi:hypothetical protein